MRAPICRGAARANALRAVRWAAPEEARIPLGDRTTYSSDAGLT